jgi:hypothetical protein
MFTMRKVYSGFSTRCNVWGRDAADPTACAHLLGQVIEAFLRWQGSIVPEVFESLGSQLERILC